MYSNIIYQIEKKHRREKILIDKIETKSELSRIREEMQKAKTFKIYQITKKKKKKEKKGTK